MYIDTKKSNKHNMISRLLSTSLLYFIFFFMTTTGNTSSHFTNETDHQALLTIKHLIQGDPLNVLSSWNHSMHFCQWHGVKCGRRHERVTVLHLSSLGLVGSISPHIGNLTFLRTINLRNNSFSGTIPQEIGRLFRLQYLLLNNNSFHSEFPTNLTRWSDIRLIDVRNNNLEGRIPTELGSLSRLWNLKLARNHFVGPIPASFGNLTALLDLFLADNSLEGSIPSQLGQLLNLEYLQISNNNLSGLFPTSLYNISSIEFFSIAWNLLQGSLPLDLGLALPKLKWFYVGSNQFYGTFPSSIANASRLVEIDIGGNSFSGPIPMNLGSLHDLQLVSFYSNSFGNNEGNELNKFVLSLSNCSNLWLLNLGYNGFRGLLPHSLANLTTALNRLYLDINYLAGTIPPGIGSLVNLHLLGLSENMLTGSIPDSIGKLSKLEQFFVYTNNISAQIPSTIGNLTQLSTLGLEENMLEGSIPVSFGNCTSLQAIDLGYNHLTGLIPEQIFGIPSLSIALFLNHNHLTGLLPMQVGNLKNLMLLDVSENQISGEIPTTLGSCQVLEFLYMEGNFFQGIIPESFRQLKGLQVLDLSRNNLTGKIPMFLGEFTSIYILNLSHNMFDGEVPNKGVFTNISALSIVGNNKLCGGLRELQLPVCPAKVLGKRKKHFILRVIIPLTITLVIVLLLLCLSMIIYRRRRSRQQTSSASPLQNQYPKLSYAELLQATNGFSATNLIGQGRYGSVYKGHLNFGEQIVAVKVLNLQERAGNKSFIAECEALRAIRHRNLVKIVTACSSIDFKGDDFKALVFEFMANGSLESWLHPSFSEQQDPKNLKIVQRLNIAIDVASALAYLHHHCATTIVHCDLKPSNVLLDDDFCALVSDFGLAKILSTTTSIANHQQSSSTGIRGTIGYVAPEYGLGGQVSTQGDMYSYGTLLIEIITGKRPTNGMFTDNFNLHNYAKMALPDRVMEIVDPKIIPEEEDESNRTEQISRSGITKIEACLASILRIGVLCSVESPSERMDVRDALKELHVIRNAFIGER